MAKKKNPTSRLLIRYLKLGSTVSLSIVTVLFLSYIAFLAYFQHKFYPGVMIGALSVANQTPTEVTTQIYQDFTTRVQQPLSLSDQNAKTYRQSLKAQLSAKPSSLAYEINLISSHPQLNTNEVIQSAYTVGRSNNHLADLQQQLKALFMGTKFNLEITFGEKGQLESQLESINRQIKIDPVDANLTFDKEITISPSSEGYELDNQNLLTDLYNYLTLSSNTPPTSLPLKITPPQFSTQEAELAKSALETVKDTPIKLSYLQDSWSIDAPTLYSLLDLRQELTAADRPQLLDPLKLDRFLLKIKAKVTQEMQNPRFQVETSGVKPKVSEFLPAREGRELDLDQVKYLITQAISGDSPKEISLPVKVTKPEIATADTNNFGIEEVIGSGLSYFAGSIENRIYNLSLAASRINGVLIPPGEIFSFNNTIGDVTAQTGYKPAYVIKSGRTVLDDGGGVCQVSTTLFRAVLNAGLPVISRTAHAYRVGYYEQSFPPGLDATVFYPTVDFKFKNDSGSHLLIQAKRVGTSLTVDLYGQDDGRVAQLTKPAVGDLTPPPPELRQDDSSLPRGTIKQVDWAAWGAKVSFKRTVTRGGQTLINETFYSNFKPWQAVYLVGTQ